MLEIVSGELRFIARFEEGAARDTVEAFRRLLPLESRLIHARWSGEACWIPFGELDVGLAPENPTSYPAPGQILVYPGGVSERRSCSRTGQPRSRARRARCPGITFATVLEGLEGLGELGRRTLWEGAQPIRFEES